MNYLQTIIERKRKEIRHRLRHQRLYTERADARLRAPADWASTLRRSPSEAPRIIAEIKLRSPSAGALRPRRVHDVISLAKDFEMSGATAISVLADCAGFGGSPLDVARVSRRVSVPVLFKEFVLHEVQVQLACAMGASLVLLLVCALDQAELAQLIAAVRHYGMEPVVEVFGQHELDRAMAVDAAIIGVNSRDLRSFRVDQAQALTTLGQIPNERVSVFMSGVKTGADLQRIAAAGADAVLVGESLMRAEHPGRQLKALLADWQAS